MVCNTLLRSASFFATRGQRCEGKMISKAQPKSTSLFFFVSCNSRSVHTKLNGTATRRFFLDFFQNCSQLDVTTRRTCAFSLANGLVPYCSIVNTTSTNIPVETSKQKPENNRDIGVSIRTRSKSGEETMDAEARAFQEVTGNLIDNGDIQGKKRTLSISST